MAVKLGLRTVYIYDYFNRNHNFTAKWFIISCMKIPIKYAIESGAWFQCRKDKFKLKILSFEKEKSKTMNGLEGTLTLQIINLNKRPVSIIEIVDNIVIKDSDDFTFYYSDYKAFIAHNLNPKIKYTGFICFHLPIEDESEYCFSIKKGSIQEV